MAEPEPTAIHVCAPRFVPSDKLAEADEIAFRVNPDNRPDDAHLGKGSEGERLVVDRRVYWGPEGVRLTVGFLDGPEPALRRKILAHMNAWNARGANVEFTESEVDPQVRIARAARGYWSYRGTDILTVPPDEPTMNLHGFTMATEDAEFFRVVRHETGHTLGFPHEHMRREIVDRLDRDKVIEHYSSTLHWSRTMVIRQVLTPLEDASVFGSATADANSIMCYQIPGELTIDGEPILGGTDIDDIDYELVAQLYAGDSTRA